jgi:hypothetical protein
VEAAGITTIDKGMSASGRSQESHEPPHLDNEKGKRNKWPRVTAEEIELDIEIEI